MARRSFERLEFFKRATMTRLSSLLMKTVFSTFRIVQEQESGLVFGLQDYRVTTSGLGDTVDLMDIVPEEQNDGKGNTNSR